MHRKSFFDAVTEQEGKLKKLNVQNGQTLCERLPQPAMHRNYSSMPLQRDEDTLERLSAQNLATTVWALAAASHASQAFFDATTE
eukprot:7672155-Karenia_brevis.AAC.1